MSWPGFIRLSDRSPAWAGQFGTLGDGGKIHGRIGTVSLPNKNRLIGHDHRPQSHRVIVIVERPNITRDRVRGLPSGTNSPMMLLTKSGGWLLQALIVLHAIVPATRTNGVLAGS